MLIYDHNYIPFRKASQKRGNYRLYKNYNIFKLKAHQNQQKYIRINSQHYERMLQQFSIMQESKSKESVPKSAQNQAQQHQSTEKLTASKIPAGNNTEQQPNNTTIEVPDDTRQQKYLILLLEKNGADILKMVRYLTRTKADTWDHRKCHTITRMVMIKGLYFWMQAINEHCPDQSLQMQPLDLSYDQFLSIYASAVSDKFYHEQNMITFRKKCIKGARQSFKETYPIPNKENTKQMYQLINWAKDLKCKAFQIFDIDDDPIKKQEADKNSIIHRRGNAKNELRYQDEQTIKFIREQNQQKLKSLIAKQQQQAIYLPQNSLCGQFNNPNNYSQPNYNAYNPYPSSSYPNYPEGYFDNQNPQQLLPTIPPTYQIFLEGGYSQFWTRGDQIKLLQWYQRYGTNYFSLAQVLRRQIKPTCARKLDLFDWNVLLDNLNENAVRDQLANLLAAGMRKLKSCIRQCRNTENDQTLDRIKSELPEIIDKITLKFRFSHKLLDFQPQFQGQDFDRQAQLHVDFKAKIMSLVFNPVMNSDAVYTAYKYLDQFWERRLSEDAELPPQRAQSLKQAEKNARVNPHYLNKLKADLRDFNSKIKINQEQFMPQLKQQANYNRSKSIKIKNEVKQPEQGGNFMEKLRKYEQEILDSESNDKQ